MDSECFDFKKIIKQRISDDIKPILKQSGFTLLPPCTFIREKDGLLQMLYFKVQKTRLRPWAYFLPIYLPCIHLVNYGADGNNISEAVLEQAVLQSIRHHIGNIIEVERILRFIETLPLKQLDVQKLDKQITAKKQELLKYQLRKTKLYEDLQDGIIDQDEYDRYKADFTKFYNEAEQALFRLNREIEDIVGNRTDKHQWITHFKEHQNIDTLSRAILVKLIDRIIISEGNKIEILFKYKYHFDRAVSFIETVCEIADYNLIEGAM